jgi:hypothetical protein
MRIAQFLVSILSIFMLIISTSTVVDLVTPISGNHAVNKAYALGTKGHRNRQASNTSSGKIGSVSDEKEGSVPHEKPISVSEPLALILLGLALLGTVVLYNRMRSRKGNKNG